MKYLANTKPFLLSLFFMFLGILSLAMENKFYGYVDQDGVLQESFFLPLGMFSFLLGAMGLLISIIWFYFKWMNKSSS